MKVYLATAGEYSDFRVLHAFVREEDARAYRLADDVMEYEVHDGPVEVRTWHMLWWNPAHPDSGHSEGLRPANPWLMSDERDFDGKSRHVEHQWIERDGRLRVQGWDREAVMKVYGEQRGKHEAQDASL